MAAAAAAPPPADDDDDESSSSSSGLGHGSDEEEARPLKGAAAAAAAGAGRRRRAPPPASAAQQPPKRRRVAPAARPAATGGAYRSLAATYAPPVDDGVYSRLARPAPSANPRAAYRAALAENDAAAGGALAPARPANAAASEQGGLAAPSASSTRILDIRLTATASRHARGAAADGGGGAAGERPRPRLAAVRRGVVAVARGPRRLPGAARAAARAREKLSGPDGIRFKALQRRVATEQSVFRNHRWKSALGETPSRYAKVADGADLSVAYRLGARKKIILAHYPPEFTRLRRPPVRAAPPPGTGGPRH